MNKLSINLDSTALGSSACILDLVRTVVGDIKEPDKGAYREPIMSVELVYGIAVHAFLDMMFKTGGQYPIAIRKAKKLFTTIPFYVKDKKAWMAEEKHLITTCYYVWSECVEKESTFDVLSVSQKCWACAGENAECPVCKGAKIIDGPATEITFHIPYYEDDYIKVYLDGTQDTIGKFRGGCFSVRDWKTTSSYNVKEYFTQYEMSRQLRFYRLACTLMAERYPDSILGKVGASHMGAFIDGIFLKPNANDTECHRSDVFQFSKEAIEAFRQTLDDKIQEISHAVKTNYFPKQGILNGACEKKFKKCQFWNVCKSNESVGNVLLGREFIRKKYDPLTFNS